MPFHLVFLSALLLGWQTSPNPPYDPPEPELPLPLYHDRPEPVAGLSLSGGSSSCSGVRWDFENGSSIRGTTYCMPVFQDPYCFYCAYLGTTTGLSGEWYLGSGVVCQLKWALPVLESRIGIDWYPMEGLRLGVGLNPLSRQLQLGWQVSNAEDFADLADSLLFAAYWLQSPG